MADEARQRELGNGLPSCLNGLEELQKPLYLSGGPRKKLLKGDYVRRRVDTALHGAPDEELLLAFYGNARNRRHLWRHWREQPIAKPGPGPKAQRPAAGDMPPSLEYCILDGMDRELLRSESSDEAVLDRLKAEVETRLETWAEADNAERRETIHLTFALASLVNDRSVLQDAVGRAAELKAEFGDLLAAPPADTAAPDEEAAPEQADPETGAKQPKTEPQPDLGRHIRRTESAFDQAFDSFGDLLDSISDAEALEIVGGFADDLQHRFQNLPADLASRQKRIEDEAATESLLAGVNDWLADIIGHPASEAIREDVEALRGRWHALPAPAPTLARSELARLRTHLPPAIESLKKGHARHLDVEDERKDLLARKPTSSDEQRKLDDLLDDCHERAVAARKRRRSAEGALLELLEAPTVAASSEASSSEAPTDADVTGTDESQVEGPAGTPPGAEVRKPVEKRGQSAKGQRPEAADAPEVYVEKTPPDGEAGRAEKEAKASPKWNEQQKRVRRAVAATLANEPPRLAHAYHLCRAAEAAGVDAGLPRAALLEAALYAAHLMRAHGELEPDLREAIQSALEGAPEEGTLSPETENAEALIGFAAALAPALLAPYSGAAALLQSLTHEGLPDLYDFCQKAAQGSWELQKAQVDAGAALRRSKRHAKREGALDKVREELRAWRGEGAKSPFRYTPANRVWEALLSEEGELGQLIHAVLATAQPDRVRTLLTDLEDHDSLRDVVDRTSKELLKARQGIDTKTFRQFRNRLGRPLELAHEYLELDLAKRPKKDHRRRVVAEFVSLLGKKLPELLQMLDGVRATAEQPLFVRAAARSAQQAAKRVQKLVDPDGEEELLDEPPAALLKTTGLFRFPAVRVTEDGEAEGEAADVLEMLLAADHAGGLESAFESRLDSEDFETAERILNWAEKWAAGDEEIGAAAAEHWRKRLDSHREESSCELRERTAGLRSDLEAAFRHGQIEPDGRTSLDALLVSVEEKLEQQEFQQGNRIRERLLQAKSDLDEARDESLKVLQEKVESAFPDKTDPTYRRIVQHLADDDLVAANELLHRSDDEPSAPDKEEGPYPPFLETYMKLDRDELRQAARDWSDVTGAARWGKRSGGLRFDELDDDDRESAAALLESWRTLKRSATQSRQKIAKAAIDLMARLGFLDVRLKLAPRKDKTTTAFRTGELTTSPLASRDECPAPYFGSQAGGRYRLLLFFDPPTAPQVLQRLQTDAGGRAPLVVCLAPLSDAAHEQLARKSFEQSLPFVTLDELLLVYLATLRPSRLAAFFELALPFTHCQPFGRRGGAVPPEMFFGREREARDVMDFHGSCFLYGGRQLGKTALLHRVRDEYSAPENGRFSAVIDLKAAGIGEADTADIWGAIWTALRELDALDDDVERPGLAARSVEAFIGSLHKRFNKDTGRTLLLLFDEADKFLERDALNSNRETFAESSRLKGLMDRDRSIKVVFAGLHNVLRTTTQSNHPLAHLGEPIGIGPFIAPLERRQAEQLLRLPLQACGYRFDPPRLALGVLARANYYPSLLQIYGDSIVNALARSTTPRTVQLPTIKRRILDEIHRGRELQEQIRQRFEWTLQLDSRYEAIAYSVAWTCRADPDVLETGADQERILDDARQWWRAGFEDVDAGRFLALLDEMAELGVLRRIHESGRTDRYTLRNPNVLTLLGNQEEIDRKLEALEGHVPEPELGPHEIRRRHGAKGPLGRPLTLWQERRIAGLAERRNRSNAVVLVCGPAAAGIAQATSFLTKDQGLVHPVLLASSRSTAGFERDLRRRILARKHPTTLFLAPAGGANWDATWIEAALEALRTLRSRDRLARVAFTLGGRRLLEHHGLIEEWERVGTVEVVRLRPWSIDFAALCLGDDPDVGQKLDQQQERRLAELTGGWPVLLELVLDSLRGGADPAELTAEEGFGALLRENAVCLRSSFCLDQEALRKTLRHVRDYGAANRRELLGKEAREISDCTLSEEDLQAAFWTAHKLHLLRETDAGLWRVDPTVARVMHATME